VLAAGCGNDDDIGTATETTEAAGDTGPAGNGR
jgi:hypothetical protein